MGRQDKNCTGIQECKRCWQLTLGNRRFEVAVDQADRVIYTFELKRTSDREYGYVQ